MKELLLAVKLPVMVWVPTVRLVVVNVALERSVPSPSETTVTAAPKGVTPSKNLTAPWGSPFSMGAATTAVKVTAVPTVAGDPLVVTVVVVMAATPAETASVPKSRSVIRTRFRNDFPSSRRSFP